MKLKLFLLQLREKIILIFLGAIVLTFAIPSLITLKVTINNIHFETIHYFVVYFIFTFIYIIVDSIKFYFQNKPNDSNIDYYRELPRNYSPSMVSVLLNLSLEYDKDVLADLLYLEQRKIIIIDSNYKIKIIEINPEFKDNESHLELLYNFIKNHENIKLTEIIKEANLLFKLEYKDKIYEDLVKLRLIENNKEKFSLTPFFIIGVIIFTALFIPCLANADIFTSLFASAIIAIIAVGLLSTMYAILFLLFLIINHIRKKNYSRTKKGKKEIAIWIAYYNFLNDFSNFEEKSFEEKYLWGYYFCYGLALGLSLKVIEKFSLKHEIGIIK